MENDQITLQKQSASEFWKAYFAKFRRRVGDHEQSETGSAALSSNAVTNLPFPDRRRTRTQRHSLLR
jgi:hypothetical protein